MFNKLLAFHNDVKIKNKYLKRVRDHAKADEIIKGTYWDNGKGCAVGCTIHSNQHNAYETELGIPQMLAKIEDCIFEGASLEWSKKWPERFLKAISSGADLSKVGWKFQHWLLLDPKEGVIRFARPEDKKIFEQVGALLWDLALGKKIDKSAWSAAWSAKSAAWSAKSAESAAKSAAESAAWSAESAAWSAESAWSAKSAAFERQGEKLLELLKEAK